MHGWLVLIELHGAWFLEVAQHQLVFVTNAILQKNFNKNLMSEEYFALHMQQSR